VNKSGFDTESGRLYGRHATGNSAAYYDQIFSAKLHFGFHYFHLSLFML
jgi:hypothetical protein